MEAAQPVDSLGIDMVSGLAQQHAAEQAAAHADLTINARNGEVDPFRRQPFAPGQHVLVDTVAQRTVEIE